MGLINRGAYIGGGGGGELKRVIKKMFLKQATTVLFENRFSKSK